MRDWLRRLHDEVHVTTVFVTHDQEEALEVADEIVVINDGRIEQVGTPDALYDEPTNEFVMGFLGPVTTLDGNLVRPHDIDVSTAATLAGAGAGTVERTLRVGHEVHLTVRLDRPEHPPVEVTTTRATARQQGLAEGVRVWLTPTHGVPVPVMPVVEAV